MSLTGSVVRVLPDDDHLDAVERTEVEGIEYQPAGRIDCMLRIFPADKRREPDEVLFLKLLCQTLFPTRFDPDVHDSFRFLFFFYF